MGSGISLRRKGGPLSLEKRIKYLRETPFSIYLTAETIDEFAMCFPQTIRTVPGKSIKLDHRKIYVVCEGEVDLSASYPQKNTKVEARGYLCRKRRGDIVSVRQAKEDIARRMTLKSHKMKDLAEDVMTVGSGDSSILLLCVDMVTLDNFSKTHPELSKPIVEICTSQIEDRLLTMPFLQEVTRSKLSVLAAMCRYEAFDSGQTVFEEDSNADKLFLVLSGVAQVMAKSGLASSEETVALQRTFVCSGDRKTLDAGTDTHHVTIAELKSGDYFGETALVFNIDRTCGVRTAGKCLFLTVHRTDFENFLKICPIEECLKRETKKRMVSKLSSLGIPFLNGIPEEMLSSLGESVVLNEVPKDHVIFKQGDVGESFYIIVHGGVRVDTIASVENEANGTGTDDGKSSNEGNGDGDEATTVSTVTTNTALGSLGPGQYFGEMSLVDSDSHMRTATVTSTQKSILLSIDKASFQKLFSCNNNILAEFELRLLKDSAKLKHILAHSLGIASFREFLEAEHAGENIDFWVAVKEFQDNEEDDLDKRKEQAKHIFVTFCANYADRQVNLPHTVLAKIDASLHGDAKTIPSDLFDAARHEIFRLLEKDKFERYKKSSTLKSFFGRLGIL
mmetsp:Transcript_14217/g.30373  ORF Transcript_14217/g.30373 Transcript_14217/m.30373 type:complete len:620 (+) Transcript_14217:167-2026(+)